MAKKVEKKEKNVFFTAEVFGMALALFCILGFTCLVSGDAIFGSIGLSVRQFVMGVFGYGSFPVLIFFTYIGIKLLIGFKINSPNFKRFIKYFAIYFVIISLILQTIYVPFVEGYGNYIASCYERGTSFTECTAGGWFLGLIAYPFEKFLTKIGALIIHSIFLIATIAVMLRSYLSKMVNRPKKEKKQKKTSTEESNGDFLNSNEENIDVEKNEDTLKEHKNIIFGGGKFELKSEKEKRAGSANKLHVLFDENEGVNTRERTETSPVFQTESYRESYDRDMESKLNFVRSPYETRGVSPVKHPMGEVENNGQDLFDMATSQINVNVPKPESDVFVINEGGHERAGIGSFERARDSRFSSENNNFSSDRRGESSSNSSTFERNSTVSGRDIFSSRMGSTPFTGRNGEPLSEKSTEGNFERNRFSDRDFQTERNNFSSSDNFGRDERDFSGREGLRNGREDNFSDSNRFSSYQNEERQPERTDNFNFERDSISGRNESNFEGGRFSQLNNRENAGVTPSNIREKLQRKPFTPFNGENRSRVDESTTENARVYRPTSSFNAGYSSENGENSRDSFERNTAESFSESSSRNAFERDNASENISSSFEDTNNEEETTSFTESYFSAEEPSKKRAVSASSSSFSGSSFEKSKPVSSGFKVSESLKSNDFAKNDVGTPSIGKSGRQISLGDIPEENMLVNPIDNMPKNYKYHFPPIDLLVDYKVDEEVKRKNIEEQSKRKDVILEILNNSNIPATIEDIKYGPAITRFEISIPPTVPLKKVIEKYGDLNLWVAARDKIRLVAPIQGTTKIGIEVPNNKLSTVGLRSLIESNEFKKAKKTSLSFCLGKDLVGNPVILDLAKMPHLLVAGATGTGKSVFLNTLLISLIYKYTPEELRIVLVDPKIVEFSHFKGIPNLMFDEIFTDNTKVCAMLEWAVKEMDERYKKLNEVLVKNIDEYNIYMAEKHGKKMPKLLIIIDEFADLMNSSSERKLMENKIGRLAAKARSAGIHLIMATQRPSADIMEGSIKTNFISRIAFKMASSTDALVIMGDSGAERLLGCGDVLFKTSTMPSAERAQGCFIDTPEIERVCHYVKEHNECYYDEFALEEINKSCEAEVADSDVVVDNTPSSGLSESNEQCVKEAMRIAILNQSVSTSSLQRKLGLGYPRAGKIMDTLEKRGYVSRPLEKNKRNIMMTPEQFVEVFGEPLEEQP